MNNVCAMIAMGLILTACSAGKSKWEGPLGLQPGLTIEDVQHVVKFNDHSNFDNIDTFNTTSPALEDVAKANSYSYSFMDKKLVKVDAEYSGEDNRKLVVDYIKKYAGCNDSGIYNTHMCFKKGTAQNDISNFIISYNSDQDSDTGEVYTNVSYRYK